MGTTTSRGNTRFSKNGVGFELHYGKNFSNKGIFFEKDGFKYIRLQESDYGFNFFNTTAQDLDVVVKIDGKRVGSFRVRSGQTFLVKRGDDSDAGFLFVMEKSSIATSRGVVVGDVKNGGLELEFRIRNPFLPRADGAIVMEDSGLGFRLNSGYPTDRRRGNEESAMVPTRPPGGPPGGRPERKEKIETSTRDRSGATIEGKKTDQHFYEIEPIADYDLDHSLSFSESFRMVVAGTPIQMPTPKPALPPRID